jgi:hypothetical protein
MNKSKSFAIRGVFGAGVGYNESKMYDFDASLIRLNSTYALPDTDQSQIEYGAQVGLMLESDIGLSLEMGLRYRQGNLLETTDEGDNQATFSLDSTEYYFGVNYLF